MVKTPCSHCRAQFQSLDRELRSHMSHAAAKKKKKMLDLMWKFNEASQVPLVVKNLPASAETRIQSLHWEDPLEEGTAAHFSMLAWRIQWTEEPGRLWSIGSQKSQTRLKGPSVHPHTYTHKTHFKIHWAGHLRKLSLLYKLYLRKLLGVSMVRTLCFHCRRHSFNPWSGN